MPPYVDNLAPPEGNFWLKALAKLNLYFGGRNKLCRSHIFQQRSSHDEGLNNAKTTLNISTYVGIIKHRRNNFKYFIISWNFSKIMKPSQCIAVVCSGYSEQPSEQKLLMFAKRIGLPQNVSIGSNQESSFDAQTANKCKFG